MGKWPSVVLLGSDESVLHRFLLQLSPTPEVPFLRETVILDVRPSLLFYLDDPARKVWILSQKLRDHRALKDSSFETRSGSRLDTRPERQHGGSGGAFGGVGD